MARRNGRKPQGEGRSRPMVQPATESEMLILGALLNAANVEQTELILSRLDPRDFALEAHRRIYEVCLHIREDGRPVEFPSIVDELGDALEAIGGAKYLSELLEMAPFRGVAIEPYIRTLQERAAARELQEACRGVELFAAEHGYDAARRLLDDRLSEIEARTQSDLPEIYTLGQVLEDPGLCAPPQVEIPRLAWAGRVTLLVAREKSGKSTFAAAAAAEKSRGGWFLGERCIAGNVLWIAIDEHMSDAAQRLSSFSASRDRMHLMSHLVGLPGLQRAIAYLRPSVTIVDHLAALASMMPEPPESGDWAAWTPIMSEIGRAARTNDCAVVVIHHAAKTGGARDSTAITAGVDMILELTESPELPDVRKVKARGRWQAEAYTVRLAGERFVLETGELSVDTRVLLFIEAHPDCSLRNVRDGVGGRALEIDAAISRLLRQGAIRDEGNPGRGRRFRAEISSQFRPNFVPEMQQEMGVE